MRPGFLFSGLGSYLNDGHAELFYEFDPSYIDQCHPNYPDCHDGQNSCPHCSDPDNPLLRVSGSIVSYSNNETIITGVTTYPNVDAEPFKVDIMPNPAKDNLTIATDYEHGMVCVHILNAYGVEVRGFVMEGSKTIDVSDLPAGIYFVNIIGGKMVTRKVVIE